MDEVEYLTPEDAANKLFPGEKGPRRLTGYTLRQAIRKRELEVYRIGGAYYVTLADVHNWIRRSCRVEAKARTSGSTAGQVVDLSGSSSTAAAKNRPAALKAIVRRPSNA
ncbi:MAG: helix-turn-helix domain-containing protein [Pseudomonadota bacterium]